MAPDLLIHNDKSLHLLSTRVLLDHLIERVEGNRHLVERVEELNKRWYPWRKAMQLKNLDCVHLEKENKKQKVALKVAAQEIKRLHSVQVKKEQKKESVKDYLQEEKTWESMELKNQEIKKLRESLRCREKELMKKEEKVDTLKQTIEKLKKKLIRSKAVAKGKELNLQKEIVGLRLELHSYQLK